MKLGEGGGYLFKSSFFLIGLKKQGGAVVVFFFGEGAVFMRKGPR